NLARNFDSYILTTRTARPFPSQTAPFAAPSGRVPSIYGRRSAQGRRTDGRGGEGSRRRRDRGGQAAAARGLPRVGVLRLALPRGGADHRRQDAEGDARRRDLRGQPLG